MKEDAVVMQEEARPAEGGGEMALAAVDSIAMAHAGP